MNDPRATIFVVEEHGKGNVSTRPPRENRMYYNLAAGAEAT